VAVVPSRMGADADGGIEQRSLVAADAAVTIVMPDAHVDLAQAEGAVRILRPERDVIHTPVTLAAALRAQADDVGADARGVRARPSVHRLVLGDTGDRDQH